MTRILCQHCQRPTKACICNFVAPVNNNINVVILQHPSEVNHSKGTAALLAMSLKQCKTLVGENFTDCEELQDIINRYHVLLLYPGESSVVLTPNTSVVEHKEIAHQLGKELCLIILDGTWKKAYRMLMQSTNLQQLKQVCLPEKYANNGQYLIRKVAKTNALSSLEACCYALALLDCTESEALALSKYQPLLNKFAQFNQFQLSFRPQS